MKVHYNSSLWAYDKGSAGLPQKVNWEFEYAGNKHIIPYIFRFSKGIVFDIITILDKEIMQEFIDKYEEIEDKLTSSQRRGAEQEHPYQSLLLKEIWINGSKVVDGLSSSSSLYAPGIQENKELEAIKKAYSSILMSDDIFGCQRYCIPYPEINSRINKLLRLFKLKRVSDMKFSTHPTHWFFPLDLQFEMDEDLRKIEFIHPGTGTMHGIYFNKGDVIKLPIDAESGSSLCARQCSYEIVPPLSENDTLQFNNSFSPKIKVRDGFYPETTGSIGIIGGADGPTAISVSSTKGTCLSVPSFEESDISHFIIEGINSKINNGFELNFMIYPHLLV